MPTTKSIIISCAGIGSRLGLNMAKCLVEIQGISLLSRHMEMLKNIPNIYIVVGYQADSVINAVLKYRTDVVFLFNHNYLETGNFHSLTLGSWFQNHDFIISLDGDLLIDPSDFFRLYYSDEELICCSSPKTHDPIFCVTAEYNQKKYVSQFTRNPTPYEWTGLFQTKRLPFTEKGYYVYEVLQTILPIPMIEVHAMDIDTVEDLEMASALF